MRTSISVLAIALTLIAAVPRVSAQSPTIASQAVLDAAVQQHLDQTATQRDAVLRVLNRNEVRTVAGKMGIDMRTAASAVAQLDGADLAAAAGQAQQVDQALAGGASTVVISTTTIIVALLVIILLVVAID
jgi:hypothetical protein